MARGTLEGTGPNKLGTTSGNCRDLGFNSISDNASVSPGTTRPKSSNPNNIASPLENMGAVSNDSTMGEVPGGTLESGGING